MTRWATKRRPAIGRPSKPECLLLSCLLDGGAYALDQESCRRLKLPVHAIRFVAAIASVAFRPGT
jgi:hypothetical protein